MTYEDALVDVGLARENTIYINTSTSHQGEQGGDSDGVPRQAKHESRQMKLNQKTIIASLTVWIVITTVLLCRGIYPAPRGTQKYVGGTYDGLTN